ncbi:LOW QUALITY PROTEIN: angiogenic factor with G patch and FHA domains 1 [Scyliorhinus canicula]|uniref:LOW QUALITY PROTEIN: angiogenic factor with G patch and FHA domains 1 n=1 Tax=Scyliorhinus canicula TaxID=7830 RepID=UPI0018F5D951|nr:LOW QUALITY PROTEIN: angiogenic factor with G patch and FHA domains 1 [Scyliorhinus canicula]
MATTDGDLHSDPDSELQYLRQKVINLQEELTSCKSQIHTLQKELNRTESYNEDLHKQVKDLNEKIHEREKGENDTVDTGVQTNMCISHHCKAPDIHFHLNSDQNGRSDMSGLEIHGACGKDQDVIQASTPFQTQAQIVNYTEQQAQTDSHQSTEQAQTDSHQRREQAQTDSHQSTEQARTDSYQSTEQAQMDSHRQREQAQTDSYQYTEVGQTVSNQYTEQAQTDSHQSTEQARTDSYQCTEEAQMDSHQSTEQAQMDSHQQREQAQTDSYQYTEVGQTVSNQYTEQAQMDSHQSTEQAQVDSYQYTEEAQTDGYQCTGYPEKPTLPEGCVDRNTENPEDLESTSIADCLRATAEAAMSQTGFTYDESSGLYYDYSTGFYYDSENQLYYDPSTGIYYYYDADSGLYQFHSRVDLLAYCTTDTAKKVKKKRKGVEKLSSKEEKKDTEADMLKASSTCRSCDSEESEILADEQQTNEKKTQVENIDQDSAHELSPNVECVHDEKDVEVKLEETGFGSEPEEGEITDSDKDDDCTDELSEEESSEVEDNESEREEDQPWPPCIRVIVVRSPVLEPGTLFIITAVKSATIGREKDMDHAIRIAEIGVSKFHAEVYFDQDLQEYMLVDQGSQNGTVVNGNRILMPKNKCDPHRLEHGDEVKFGETVLSFHIHPGTDTCNGCEPGQVKAHMRLNKKEVFTVPVLSKQDKDKLRRQELKQIQVKYGLQNSAYEGEETLKNSMYKDRAAKRRQVVGSDGIYRRDDAPASVNTEICDSNKGRKMLEKMGWKKGEGLGKESCGIKEPIQIQLHQSQSGLGATAPLSIEDVQMFKSKKQKNWAKARERFSETFQQTTSEKAAKVIWVKGECVKEQTEDSATG